jgi:hypothetical protein
MIKQDKHLYVLAFAQREERIAILTGHLDTCHKLLTRHLGKEYLDLPEEERIDEQHFLCILAKEGWWRKVRVPPELYAEFWRWEVEHNAAQLIEDLFQELPYTIILERDGWSFMEDVTNAKKSD